MLESILYGIVLAAYIATLVYITAYCVSQLQLLWAYLRKPKAAPVPPPLHWPKVTVQLPIYNERYVAARIIDQVCAFDYPTESLHIQVLDDSNDDTVTIIAQRVEFWRKQGIQIDHVRRIDRKGFKAGALAKGLEESDAEFVAIFDADFVPKPDFLKKSVPHFSQDARIGVVQSRWQHLNEDYSLITRLQALQLNVHFSVEQSGRRQAGLFAQFNGTAGVWRRECIEDAGGWRAETLTEDLDLSIRAQLRGWEICYLEDNQAPAELPMEMNAFKSQQHRWMKGGAENARLLIPKVWAAKQLSFGQKLHITGHLLASTIFLFVFAMGLLSVPTALAIAHFSLPGWYFSGFLAATLAVIAVYYVGNVKASWVHMPWGKRLLRFVLLFPTFLSLSMGLSLHNALAVVEGYIGRKTPFIRTPKFGLDQGFKLEQNTYRHRKLSLSTWLEGVMAVFYSAALCWGIKSGNDFFLIFHAMLALGFAAIFLYTVKDSLIIRSKQAAPPLRPAQDPTQLQASEVEL